MPRWITRIAILAIVALPAGCGGEPKRGTAEEAQAMVEKAIARYQEVGAEKAFAEFSDLKGAFVDRDLYVFVIGPDSKVVAHGADSSRIGLDATTLADEDGKAYGKELLAATAEGVWVDYKFKNPVSQQVEPKSSFAKLVDGYVFGCGFYKP